MKLDLDGARLIVSVDEAMKAVGGTQLRPRGSLAVSGGREMLVNRSVPAAYGGDGRTAEDTLRYWGERCPDRYPDECPDRGATSVCDEEVVWAGILMGHYGHFLTEGVSRLWPLLPGGALERLPVVFTLSVGSSVISDWLGSFGVCMVALPPRTVRFTQMHVPEPAFHFRVSMSPELRDVHLHARNGLDASACGQSTGNSEVLWLSRSDLKRNWRAAADECLLEWLLEAHVRMINPEALPLAAQVAELESSRAVVGIVGSAFYTLLMTRDPPRHVLLCPPLKSFVSPYLIQARLLRAHADFAPALEKMPGAGHASPGNPRYKLRLLLPQVLRALSATVLPGLMEDPRVGAFASAARGPSSGVTSVPRQHIEGAVMKVLRDPFSSAARMDLGGMFEAANLDRCALEQYAVVADLGEAAPRAFRAARRMAHAGRADAGSPPVKRILAIDPDFREAVDLKPDLP